METIERRLQRAEALLQNFMPGVNLDDESLDSVVKPNSLPPKSHQGSVSSAPSLHVNTSASPDPSLESMVNAAGQLDLDERGNWDYHGHSSGLSFLRRTREHFGNIVGPEQQTGQSRPVNSRSRDSQVALNSAGSSVHSVFDSPVERTASIRTDDLPSKDVAHQLCSHALDDATCILMVVHQPSFYNSLDRIYKRAPEEYENEDHQFLPLLYAVMALGCLFRQEDSDLGEHGYANDTDEG